MLQTLSRALVLSSFSFEIVIDYHFMQKNKKRIPTRRGRDSILSQSSAFLSQTQIQSVVECSSLEGCDDLEKGLRDVCRDSELEMVIDSTKNAVQVVLTHTNVEGVPPETV